MAGKMPLTPSLLPCSGSPVIYIVPPTCPVLSNQPVIQSKPFLLSYDVFGAC